MHYVTVDGYPLPAPFGGHPALEFCNTWSGWADPPDLDGPVDRRREYLAGPDQLAVWLGHAGLADPAEVAAVRTSMAAEPSTAGSVWASVRALRSAAYALLTGTGADLDRAAERVGRHADLAAARSELRRRPDGTFVRTLAGTTPRRCLDSAAHAVEDLLTGPDLGLVRRCPGADCGWLFLDRTGRRRWCSMTRCGNRAKVAAYGRRQRHGS